ANWCRTRTSPHCRASATTRRSKRPMPCWRLTRPFATACGRRPELLRWRGGRDRATFEAMNTNFHAIDEWHRIVRERDAAGLKQLLDPDAVFHSPVVHTPQRGRRLVAGYLSAALQVFGAPEFRYLREIRGESEVMLEFETVIDGVQVNGVDIIRWNEAG